MTLPATVEEHLKSKPIRPNAATCTAMQWSEYNRKFLIWNELLEKLTIEAIRPEIQAKVEGKVSSKDFGRALR